MPADHKNEKLVELRELAEEVILSTTLLTFQIDYGDMPTGTVEILIPLEVHGVSTRIQHFQMNFSASPEAGKAIDVSKIIKATKAMHSLKRQMNLKTLFLCFGISADGLEDSQA